MSAFGGKADIEIALRNVRSKLIRARRTPFRLCLENIPKGAGRPASPLVPRLGSIPSEATASTPPAGTGLARILKSLSSRNSQNKLFGAPTILPALLRRYAAMPECPHQTHGTPR